MHMCRKKKKKKKLIAATKQNLYTNDNTITKEKHSNKILREFGTQKTIEILLKLLKTVKIEIVYSTGCPRQMKLLEITEMAPSTGRFTNKQCLIVEIILIALEKSILKKTSLF